MFRTDIGRQILPVVVAHRGASASYPENTLASFQGAIDAGADIVELDVRLSADGVPVIMHNAEVDATTDGSGWVHELTLAELKRLDASRGRGSRAEIPTLEEAFRFLSGKAGINVEIKNMPGEPAFDSPREAAAEQVVILLDRIGFDGPMLVSSFNWLSIERVKELEPQVPTGFLTIGPFDPYACLVYVRSRGHDYVLPQVPAVLDAGEAFIRAAHDDGVLVGTWVMDEPEGLERLFAIGVDAVATNDPTTAVPIRDRYRARSD
jgi:glycerophosphoryl diester phosphodiesterase